MEDKPVVKACPQAGNHRITACNKRGVPEGTPERSPQGVRLSRKPQCASFRH